MSAGAVYGGGVSRRDCVAARSVRRARGIHSAPLVPAPPSLPGSSLLEHATPTGAHWRAATQSVFSKAHTVATARPYMPARAKPPDAPRGGGGCRAHNRCTITTNLSTSQLTTHSHAHTISNIIASPDRRLPSGRLTHRTQSSRRRHGQHSLHHAPDHTPADRRTDHKRPACSQHRA